MYSKIILCPGKLCDFLKRLTFWLLKFKNRILIIILCCYYSLYSQFHCSLVIYSNLKCKVIKAANSDILCWRLKWAIFRLHWWKPTFKTKIHINIKCTFITLFICTHSKTLILSNWYWLNLICLMNYSMLTCYPDWLSFSISGMAFVDKDATELLQKHSSKHQSLNLQLAFHYP